MLWTDAGLIWLLELDSLERLPGSLDRHRQHTKSVRRCRDRGMVPSLSTLSFQSEGGSMHACAATLVWPTRPRWFFEPYPAFSCPAEP